MDTSDDELLDHNGDIQLDGATNKLLDQDPDKFNPYLPLDKFQFGSEDYCDNFKKALAAESKLRTKHGPFPWQLEVAFGCHLGRDGFLLAGTGSGKTLAMIGLAFLDKRHRVFLISPLNALANAQVKQFEDWGLTAVAVNATMRYKDLYKDIKNGKHQIIISSIEAFLDPTRLLPIVKSPELAALGPQLVIIDEAHCIIKWGPHFRPEYGNIGTLKLLLTGESPFIATTATANRLMQEPIKQSLQFGSDAFEVSLGNRRSNIAYSVHCLKSVSAAATELLEYFPSKTHVDGFTLRFVDSRKLGNEILYKF
ncbi:DEAD/DEAH-box helicase, partial [Rhizoctonia solani AG-3 Rhs1AP]